MGKFVYLTCRTRQRGNACVLVNTDTVESLWPLKADRTEITFISGRTLTVHGKVDDVKEALEGGGSDEHRE